MDTTDLNIKRIPLPPGAKAGDRGDLTNIGGDMARSARRLRAVV